MVEYIDEIAVRVKAADLGLLFGETAPHGYFAVGNPAEIGRSGEIIDNLGIQCGIWTELPPKIRLPRVT